MKPSTQKPHQETPEEKQARETVETIATTIAQLSRQVTALLNGRVKRETIVLLLSHATKLPQRDIGYVLNAIEDMERTHVKE